VRGVKDKRKKEAAEGATLGALTAYLMESGRGHELNLPKGAKLELELERALYLVKELGGTWTIYRSPCSCSIER